MFHVNFLHMQVREDEHLHVGYVPSLIILRKNKNTKNKK